MLEKYPSLVFPRLTFCTLFRMVLCHEKDQLLGSSLPVQNWAFRTCYLSIWEFPHQPSFSFYLQKHFMLIRPKGVRGGAQQDQLKDFFIGTEDSRKETILGKGKKNPSTLQDSLKWERAPRSRSSKLVGKASSGLARECFSKGEVQEGALGCWHFALFSYEELGLQCSCHWGEGA